MDQLIEQLKLLYEYELYEDVPKLATTIMALYQRTKELTVDDQYSVYCYFGYSLFNLREYRKAISVLYYALQIYEYHVASKLCDIRNIAQDSEIRKKLVLPEPFNMLKLITKSKIDSCNNSQNTNNNSDIIIENESDYECVQSEISSIFHNFCESDVKYKIALCYRILKNDALALDVLNSVPEYNRSPKINMLIGRLMMYDRKQKKTICKAYREVLKKIPLTISAIEDMLALGVLPTEICPAVTAYGLKSDWIMPWINVQRLIYAGKFTKAIHIGRELETKSMLGDAEFILTLIGKCHYFNGDHDNALKYLERVRRENGYLNDYGLSILGTIYYVQKKNEELENLAIPSLEADEYNSDNWFILALLATLNGRMEKSYMFLSRANLADKRNVEVVLLKTKLFIQTQKHTEAVAELFYMMEEYPYRFEIYTTLISSNLARENLSEAQRTIEKVIKIFGKTSRTLVLMADLFATFNGPMLAIKMLYESLKFDPYHLPSVYLLVDLLRKCNKSKHAYKILRRQIKFQANSKLYCVLGDICLDEKNPIEAISCYNKCLCLEPYNPAAVRGLTLAGNIPKSTKVRDLKRTLSPITDINVEEEGCGGGGGGGGGSGSGSTKSIADDSSSGNVEMTDMTLLTIFATPVPSSSSITVTSATTPVITTISSTSTTETPTSTATAAPPPQSIASTVTPDSFWRC